MTPRWYLAVCGINYKTGSIEDREPLQITRERIPAALAIFAGIGEVREAAILSTCNRVEFYFVAIKGRTPFDIVREFYTHFNANICLPKEKFYSHSGQSAAEHLLRVASGMESMIFGENQILGQTKETYSAACAARTAGKIIHRLFHQAFRAGKSVRADTEMGRGACSMAGAAVGLLKTKLDENLKPSVLFIGANQMISLAASSLSKAEFGPFHFANRTLDRAHALAQKYAGTGHGLNDLQNLLAQVEVVITCTGAGEPILTENTVLESGIVSSGHKLIIVDLAMPRDTNFESGRFNEIEVYHQEHIHRFVGSQQSRRREATAEAEEIIRRKLEEFMYWFNQVRGEGLYDSATETIELFRKEEIDPVVENLSEESRRLVEQASRRLVDRLYHYFKQNQIVSNKGE